MADLMETHEAATFLGIKPQTLAVWRLQGKGPQFVKIGRLVRYKRHILEHFLETQTRKNTCIVSATQ